MQASSNFESRNSTSISAAKNGFSDEVLWSNFKTGNELALSMLYKKHIQRVYDFGMHTCRDHDLVMDCIQDLFCGLWTKRESLSDIQFVKPYLFKSLRRLIINYKIESRKHSAPLSEKTVAFEFIQSIESILIEDEQKDEQAKRLSTCIQSLTKGQREIIYLKFYNQLSYQEIAEITELRVDSIYNLMSKTIELLRKKLQVAKPHIPGL